MNIFKYWHCENVKVSLKGKTFYKKFYFGSNISLEHAKENCAKNIKEKTLTFENLFISKNRESNFKEYDSDVIEEVLLNVSNDSLNAFVTRNNYGCEVLCVDKMMILDIDNNTNFSYHSNLPKYTFLEKILSKCHVYTKKYLEKKSQIQQITQEIEFLAKKYNLTTEFEKHSVYQVSKILKNYPNINLRFYRTTNGWRLIETSAFHEPKSADVWNLMTKLCVDKTYMLFCLRQNCFRARLTPKPWRIGMQRLDIRYPPDTKDNEQKYLQWIGEYNKIKNNFSTIKFKFEMGSCVHNSNVDKIITFHDSYHNSTSTKLK